MERRQRFSSLATEMAVIVASILLAFGLDAWWDGRKQTRESRTTLAALATEFDAAALEIAFSEARNRRVVAAADTLLQALRDGGARVELNGNTLGALLLTPTTNPMRGTVDALIASGRLDQVCDQPLHDLVANWPAALEDVQEEEAAARDFVLRTLLPYLGRKLDLSPAFQWRLAERVAAEHERTGGRSTIPIPAGVPIWVARDPEFINMVLLRQYLANYTLTNLPALRNTLHRIRSELHSVQGRSNA